MGDATNKKKKIQDYVLASSDVNMCIVYCTIIKITDNIVYVYRHGVILSNTFLAVFRGPLPGYDCSRYDSASFLNPSIKEIRRLAYEASVLGSSYFPSTTNPNILADGFGTREPEEAEIP